MGVFGIEGALMASTTIPVDQATSTAIDTTTQVTRLQSNLKAYQDNQLMMHHLKISTKTQALTNKIVSVKTTAWAGGKVCNVMKVLKKQYCSDDKLSRMDLMIAMNRVTMKK